ncbi:non-hydrolyzing UDP-N-acetylglucosamine 2-epimerase [Rothia sp. CCM 9416]|uniref:non-hydrolyzing UDP-N-acetylglucosamine 2-epimerase n=1 Tax=Rothia sp. CCM 9416 TaxID=3402655 RepID=UPI003AED5DD1
MSPRTIMTIYGTRPEAIKVAPIIQALESSADFTPVVVSTGQHRDMLEQVQEIFHIRPDYELDIMQPGQGLNQIAQKIMGGLDRVLQEQKPAAIIVQGDTTSALYGALAAFNLQIPVVHMEAGLRSGDLASPFPEEGNRKLISQIASLHLAPTDSARRNLLHEGVGQSDIRVTGNSVIDALLSVVERGQPSNQQDIEGVLNSGRRIIVVTSHRRENYGRPMENIGRALARLAQSYPTDLFVFPAHKSPATRQTILPLLEDLPNLMVIEPLDYQEFIWLLEASYLVLTDSGGLQEEAPSLGKPVLVLRETTERPEAVEAGTVLLVGTGEEDIVAEASKLLDSEDTYRAMAVATNPYGDGKAAERTVQALSFFLGLTDSEPEEFAVGLAPETFGVNDGFTG